MSFLSFLTSSGAFSIGGGVVNISKSLVVAGEASPVPLMLEAATFTTILSPLTRLKGSAYKSTEGMIQKLIFPSYPQPA
jgi:hypothetical protein